MLTMHLISSPEFVNFYIDKMRWIKVVKNKSYLSVYSKPTGSY